MVVGEVAERRDLLVIGGGVGGYVEALRAAELGADVTVVDRTGTAGLGGVCLHEGCIPSKALIEFAHRVEGARGVVPAELLGSWRPDVGAAMEQRRRASEGLAAKIASRMSSLGVEVIAGHARFNRPNRVAVECDDSVQFLEFERCVIAAGSRPRELSSLPWRAGRVVDSTAALQLVEVPDRLVVVGGGYVGLELGSAYAQLGAEVTVIEASAQLLPGLEGDLVRPVLAGLKRLGVRVMTSTEPTGIEDQGLAVRDAHEHHLLGTDLVVVAAGRVPNTDDLGLAQARVPVTESGLIAVDTHCLVRPGLAAIGDITPGPALAHKASAQAVVAAESLAGMDVRFEPATIPSVVFTDPEIAMTGLTLAEARAQGMQVKSFTASLKASGRASAVNSDGFYRIVVDTGRDVVVGAQVVSPHASDVISELSLAVEFAASPWDIALTIHPHPTFSESFHDAAMSALSHSKREEAS